MPWYYLINSQHIVFTSLQASAIGHISHMLGDECHWIGVVHHATSETEAKQQALDQFYKAYPLKSLKVGA